MAAGDLITADYQLELNEYLVGDGCDWMNTVEGWSDPTGGGVRTVEAPLALSPGTAVGFDVDDGILFTASLFVSTVPGDVWGHIVDLREAWKATGYTDVELHMQLPGLGRCWLLGRPRGADVEVRDARQGVAYALVTFRSTDGVLHFPDPEPEPEP